MDLAFLVNKPAVVGKSFPKLILAHGAGAPMDSEFMEEVSSGVASCGIEVLRFEFPYMANRRETGRRRPPDRTEVLLDCFRSAVQMHGGPGEVVIGGKSMGGRVATLLASEECYRGVVVLGYPFHPAGKPDKTRVSHLSSLLSPVLVFQGERDALGNREEVKTYRDAGMLGNQFEINWLEDGDHDLKPRKRSGYDYASHINRVVRELACFVLDRSA